LAEKQATADAPIIDELNDIIESALINTQPFENSGENVDFGSQ